MDADAVVIGAGVVGLACAAELARRGRSVLVIEQHDEIGRETSSRNSEVIHAGIYYPAGSLKATACVEGRALLYRRCARDGIAHRRLGKLIVATSRDEVAELDGISARALENGAGGIERFEADDVAKLEPEVRSFGAVWSPETGIVDAHGLMRSYQAELEANEGRVVLRTRLLGLSARSFGWEVATESAEGDRFEFDCGFVVNAAGLAADRVAELAGLDADVLGWRTRYCKGDYFSVAPAARIALDHLIYPVPPGDGGLGIHVTLDLGGRLRLGPDATYIDEIGYGVSPDKAEAFAAAARAYLPRIRGEHLAPEMAGIRPKLQGPGEPFRDFVLAESSDFGAPAMVHLVGIESPGLTAAGALARRAADLAGA
jgi:L-2-hydroxyglutarate oxidase LhgO